MFKICVIGCGGISTSGHGPSLVKYKKGHPDISLAACCDLSEEKAVRYKDRFGFERHYTDYVDMLDEIHPNVVCLICPVHLTCRLSTDVMKRGYNMILEKPPGLNREEIGQMIRQAELSGVSVCTAFNRRYTPLILKLKEMLKQSGERIFNLTYQMYRYRRNDRDFSTTAIHAIDAVKFIADSDYSEVAFAYQDLGESMVNIHLNCRLENGAMADIALIPMGGVVSEHISVNTLDNTYYVELPFWSNWDSPGRLRHFKETRLTEDISGADLVDCREMFEESGFYEENRSFFEMLRAGENPGCDLYSGIQSVEIADCIREKKQKYMKL